MKKLLLLSFVFVSLSVFAQRDLKLNVGEEKVIEGGEWNISMAEGSILYIKGYTTITSLNKYKNSTISIEGDAFVNIESSLNIQGGSNLFILGKLTAINIEVHGEENTINIQGKLQSYSNFVLNDGTSKIQVCGEVEVSENTNWNPQTEEKQIALCNCGVWRTHRLNSHTKNIVTGMGSVYYKYENIREPLSTNSTVVINQDCRGALPIEIISFDVKYNEIGEKQYNLKLSEESTPRTFVIFESEDGVNWKEIVRREIFMEQSKSVGNNFSGIIK